MAGKEDWQDHGKQLQSCALAGAASMLSGITDAMMIANGPAWCYFYAMRMIDKPSLDVGNRFLCTYPSNGAVVFGTEKEVMKTLEMVKGLHPGVVLLENSCALSLIGDDLEGMAMMASLDCPVITLDSGGLRGDFWAGYVGALQGLIKKFRPKKIEVEPLTVNLLGVCASYYYEEADVRELVRLLSLMGIKVQLILGLGHTAKEVEMLGKAALNIVVHEELGIAIAKQLETMLGTPYIAPILPYGYHGTLAWAKSISEAVGEEISLEKLEEEIESKKRRQFEQVKEMQRLWGEPYFERTVLAGPRSLVKGMANVIREEWLLTDELLLVFHDATMDTVEHWQGEEVFSIHDNRWVHYMEGANNLLVLASNHEKKVCFDLGLEQQLAYQSIANPVNDEVVLSDRPFMGLLGHQHMVERLWNLYIQYVEREAIRGQSLERGL